MANAGARAASLVGLISDLGCMGRSSKGANIAKLAASGKFRVMSLC